MNFDINTFGMLAGSLLPYYLLRKNLRPYVLLFCSCLYCWFLSPQALFCVLAVTFVYYLLGIALERLPYPRILFAAATACGIGALLFLKNVPLLQSVASEGSLLTRIVLPLGFSYYMFQAISYLADIRAGKIKAETNFCFFALYMLWFPKFLSGPIERAGDFLSQLRALPEVRLFEKDRIMVSLRFLLYGFFLKLMIAERLSPLTEKLFADPGAYSAPWLFLGMLFYTLELYCDFAGYSYVALGISHLFGIDIRVNFRMPYLAVNISDFWRRWHITLSTWLKDYLYIPLGGSRKGTGRKYLNLMIVFVACGLWHGGGGCFLIWGLLHGAYSVLCDLAGRKGWKWLTEGFTGWLLTFAGVNLAWIFFRVPNLSHGLVYIKRMLLDHEGVAVFAAQARELGADAWFWGILLLSLAVVIFWEVLSERKHLLAPEGLGTLGELGGGLCFYALLMGMLIFGIYGVEASHEFIYMNF
jgi:D-alanyl-lipoteichoic acid acyltransferase DltB (MBOAT superfamily)